MVEEATTRHRRITGAKEIKVKIPLEYHIKLHTLKVLKGQSISDTVERALEQYFADENGPGQFETFAGRTLGQYP